MSEQLHTYARTSKELDELEYILNTFKTNASLPFEEATSLPPQCFNNQALYDMEVDNIFHKEWQMVCRADELKEPGDYITWDILKTPVYVIKTKEGDIRAFSNVCLHRACKLLDGPKGNSKLHVCRYHAWSYDLTGQLKAAPRMDRTPGFNKNALSLPELRCEVFLGSVWVNIDRNAKPVNEVYADLAEFLSDWKLEEYVSADNVDMDLDTNWKVYCENFFESYHSTSVHDRTFQRTAPVETTEIVDLPEGAKWSLHHITQTEASTAWNAGQDDDKRNLEDKARVIVGGFFPNILITLAQKNLNILVLMPDGTKHTNIRYLSAWHPDTLAEGETVEYAQERLRPLLFDGLFKEDTDIISFVDKGTTSIYAPTSRYCWMEKPLWEFQCYLSRVLNDDD